MIGVVYPWCVYRRNHKALEDSQKLSGSLDRLSGSQLLLFFFNMKYKLDTIRIHT